MFKKIKSLRVVLVACLVSAVGYTAAGNFTEINSSGDVVYKLNPDHVNKQLTTAFESPYTLVTSPERSQNLWNKISETIKYHEVKAAPLTSSNNKIHNNNKVSVLNPFLEKNKQLAAMNEKLIAENKDWKERVIQLENLSGDLEEKAKLMERQINFLAMQLQSVETDLLLVKSGKNFQENLAARK